MTEIGFDPRISWEKYAETGLPPGVARANMAAILDHFVKCGWGGCYPGIFDKLIRPNLDDVDVLRAFLCSPTIRPTEDAKHGARGERIFYDLFKFLMNVESAAIRGYLRETFPEIASRFDADPFTVRD